MCTSSQGGEYMITTVILPRTQPLRKALLRLAASTISIGFRPIHRAQQRLALRKAERCRKLTTRLAQRRKPESQARVHVSLHACGSGSCAFWMAHRGEREAISGIPQKVNRPFLSQVVL